MSELGTEARRFLRGQGNGVLSTLSQRLAGYPFGSVAPYVADQAGRPVILISTLAEHTKNIQADPRVSLIVQPFMPDMQETGRVTVIGRAQRLADKDRLGPRYLRYFPKAEAYLAMHDFAFYRIEPVRIRYIGGFGKIHWVEPQDYLLADGKLEEEEAAIVAHMNADHAHTLRDYCRHVHQVDPRAVDMLGMDGDGFDVRADGRLLRFDLPVSVTDAASARSALVALARQGQA